jgi:hypothetical protein
MSTELTTLEQEAQNHTDKVCPNDSLRAIAINSKIHGFIKSAYIAASKARDKKYALLVDFIRRNKYNFPLTIEDEVDAILDQLDQ